MPQIPPLSIARDRLHLALGRAYSETQLGQDPAAAVRRLKDFIKRPEIAEVVTDHRDHLAAIVFARSRGTLSSAFIETIQLRLLREALGDPAEEPVTEPPPTPPPETPPPPPPPPPAEEPPHAA